MIGDVWLGIGLWLKVMHVSHEHHAHDAKVTHQGGDTSIHLVLTREPNLLMVATFFCIDLKILSFILSY